ncbi:MAG: hypothetical protein M1536_00425 [Firmicutes bacterium]|nr:hypothetical protein [Bacillota bacterium]
MGCSATCRSAGRNIKKYGRIPENSIQPSPVLGIGLSGYSWDISRNYSAGITSLASSLLFAVAFIILHMNIEKKQKKKLLNRRLNK